MDHSYKPDGYNSVTPYLIVDGADGTIDFLIQTFDAVQLRRFNNEEGKIMHAEVLIDDSIIMLADKAEEWPPTPSYVHIYVPDVDATYQRALNAGAESVQAPVQKDDPDKRGGVKDTGGTTWWISTQVAL
ncbi:MAG: extradiol dioxygenase [Ardenticatenaceae bacterium]|nr:MAG: extradiol dioxygenase [Ardenticatenaceae bacterium]